MRRVRFYRGENYGPGKDVQGELDLTPGIREQPGSQAVVGRMRTAGRLRAHKRKTVRGGLLSQRGILMEQTVVNCMKAADSTISLKGTARK